MKFILAGLGNWFNDYRLIEKAILQADRYEFDGALLPDHYMWGNVPWIPRSDTNKTLETWMTISYLLAKTEHIKIGTLVTPIPLRPPSVLAKMISTADNLSGGRTIVGVGAGWSQIEFEGYSEWNSPSIRVNKTYEGLELMIKLWTENEVNFEGKYYRAKGAVLDPKPVQKPYPKILFGSRGKRMLKLAGQYGDICFFPPWPGSDPDEMKQIVIDAAHLHNRIDKISFMLGEMRPIDIEEYFAKVEKALDSGADYFLASFQRSEELLDTIRKFAEDIIPSFK
ncbi:MAG: LLM class flavin-dependent oxidoreductase [Candidatus Bathyarchaeota archaeon]|jgi:alkanesulfonate monooxygenase SsuD/methylene tetrahydromethanopterin reductase-like flavin-dependent oxidoreductase (luciferase family)|nr:LLM class flavin-dependent oxidoreductase [Candidatus Bathyarchaeota archaeon]